MPRVHLPVMLNEVIENIYNFKAGTYLDATFGDGGHSEKLLNLGAEKVIGLDRDPTSTDNYSKEGTFKNDPKLEIHTMLFSEIEKLNLQVDGIVIDLGVSTRQLMDFSRGFSFHSTSELDMRMDQKSQTLEEILSRISKKELENKLIENIGDLRARFLARDVFEKFKSGKIQDTQDLAQLRGFYNKWGRHQATALFLGLRMLVNNELEEIRRGIPRLVNCLKKGGRLAVLTYHSTEDREVKNIFKFLRAQKIIKIVTKKPLLPTPFELSTNPRARSAKLRCVEKEAL